MAKVLIPYVCSFACFLTSWIIAERTKYTWFVSVSTREAVIILRGLGSVFAFAGLIGCILEYMK
jgi:hypothetical protein